MNKALIEVYGCQMNAAEAERMAGELERIGYEPTDSRDDADVIILHTCCVRESAEEKIYGKLGELKGLKRQRPNLILGISGCMAQKEAASLFKRAPHLDFVLGTGELTKLADMVQLIADGHKRIAATTLTDEPPERAFPIRRGAVSAWIPIMYGCDNFCTYCIVPYVRGRERSRSPKDIIAEAEAALAEGYGELTLLGQNVNSYGKGSGGVDFADLLAAVDKLDELKRLRFMTSHPKDTSDRLIKVMAEGEHIAPHIHLPAQHGSDSILKAMNRGYTAAHYLALVKKIRAAVPRVALTTDIIVGFPGETEEDFRQTLDLVRKARFDAAYTFLYSPRSGTRAADFPNQVPEEVKNDGLPN